MSQQPADIKQETMNSIHNEIAKKASWDLPDE